MILLIAFSGLFFPPLSFAQSHDSCPQSVQLGTSTLSLYTPGTSSGDDSDLTWFICDYEDNDALKDQSGYSTKWMTVNVREFKTQPVGYSDIDFCTDSKKPHGSEGMTFTYSDSYSFVVISTNVVAQSEIPQSLADKFTEISNIALSCDGTEEKSAPIIFLPGVGGSRLGTSFLNLWPIPAGDTTLLFMNENGEPTDPSVQEGRILDVGSSAVNFYGSIMDRLDQTEEYTLGNNLIPYPYDWRLSLDSHLSELDRTVNQLRVQTDSEKVILIAHSMGGVIAKAYAQELGKNKVDTVITIGTPYFGAVKPFYALADGYNFGNPSFLPEFMKRLAQNAPGVYHLLPPYDFVFEYGKPVDRNVFLNNVRYAALDNELLDSGRNSFAILDENTWSPNKLILNNVNNFNQKYIGTLSNPKPLPTDIKHYVIVGTGVSTLGMYNLADAVEETESYIEFGNRKVVLDPIFVDGDGTVPLTSSKFKASDKIFYVKHKSTNSAEHSSLPANKDVQKIILEILDDNIPSFSPYSCDSLYVTTSLTGSDKESNFMIPNYPFRGNDPYPNQYYSDSQGSVKNCENNITSIQSENKITSEMNKSQNESSNSFMDVPDMLLTEHGTINLDKEKIIIIEKSIPLQIHGKVAGYQKGNSFEVIVETPNGDIFELSPKIASGGTYVTGITVEPTDPEGVYAIVSVRNGEVIAKASITVQKDTVSSKPKSQAVPDWVKNNAKWWAEGQIGDDSFVQGIQYLVKENVISIPKTPSGAAAAADAQVPDWVKNNAKWWAAGQIEEGDFLKGIEFMAQQGIIRVN